MSGITSVMKDYLAHPASKKGVAYVVIQDALKEIQRLQGELDDYTRKSESGESVGGELECREELYETRKQLDEAVKRCQIVIRQSDNREDNIIWIQQALEDSQD